ncbi:methionine--tRNA ligase, partial [Cobetia sp. SIMBA_158]
MPELTNNAKEFLNLDDLRFASRNEWLLGHKINKFKPLMQRIEEKDIEAMVEHSKASLTQADAPAPTDNSKPAAKDKAPAT